MIKLLHLLHAMGFRGTYNCKNQPDQLIRHFFFTEFGHTMYMIALDFLKIMLVQ